MSPALISALNHPLRRQILRLFSKTNPEWSPIELAKSLPAGVSYLSHHMKVLSDLDILEETRTESVRGSTKHFYVSILRDNKMMRSILAKTKDDDKDFFESR